MAGFTVDPHQLLGMEVNPRAAAIAELVLWIGYLQWHFRTRGRVTPPEPIIKAFHNIVCRDAVLAWDRTEPVLDDKEKAVTRWDGRTMKQHPVTGEEVPDETARVPLLKYIKPRPAKWPEADFIVGNPPFIGTARMRDALGDGYTEAVREAHAEVGESSDFVMYWWNIAAHLVREGRVQRFGFITTNSLRQTFNRRVLEPHLEAKDPLSLVFAIPDHPWVDSVDGAQVRIAMTVARAGQLEGKLRRVTHETPQADGDIEVALAEQHGVIHADLTVGANVAAAEPLSANEGLSCPGVKLHGSGFIVTPDEAKNLGLGRIVGLEKHIRLYRNGRDLTATSRDVLAIDLFGLTAEEVRQRFPEAFQWVLDRVKPERDQNNRQSYRENWWVFGEPRGNFRPALDGLRRYIVTVETMKHRLFVFLDASILPDNKLIALAFDDAYFLGVLSSRLHVVWALASGSHLGVGNDPVYVKSASFEKFPFPVVSEAQQTRIRELAESLDAHRKRQQAQHPKLTLTDIYNVLEKLRAGTSLDAGEQVTHEQGLVSVLRQLHDDLDAAVVGAYGLAVTATDEEILTHLCALNAQRAAEERAGNIRWLRPSFQHPATTTQATLDTGDTETVPVPAKSKATAKLAWPKTLAEQAQAVRAALSAIAVPADAVALAKTFKSAKIDRIEDILETLASLGQARTLPDGRYVAR
jgi:hypothetical protein